MAALSGFLPLAISLLLGHQTFAQNDAPCQKSKWNNGFNIFEERHILKQRLPTTFDQNEWEKHIKKDNKCNRTTQSFLGSDMLDKVKAVCKDGGKKMYMRNLCISNEPFTFFTVRIEKGTCNIWSVSKETKHLILGCVKLEDQCLPVHFEANPRNRRPHISAKSCQDPERRGHIRSFSMPGLQ